MIRIGIPRVLNMYENYPFWHTLFAECGFEVVLSPESNMELYQKGISSVMSDNICFPAKLVHGHIIWLIEAKVDRIFYPIVQKEAKEWDGSSNSYNCPVVSGYPEVIRSAINPEGNYGIPFDKPVVSFHDIDVLRRAAYEYFSGLGIDKDIFLRALGIAWDFRNKMKKEMIIEQKALLDKCLMSGELVFIVAGRPYHADSLVNQKVGQILADLGITALTDDVFLDPHAGEKPNSKYRLLHLLGDGFKRLNMVSQWSYPNRVVHAAMEVAKLPDNLQLIQLNSFGCGPDSFYMEEVGQILRQAGKNHTVLRIDEIASPGSIRLRIRSLIESLRTVKGK